MRWFSLVLFFLTSVQTLAQQGSANLNQIAVGQGISSPSVANTTLFSNGFTKENPVAASYQSQYRLTGSLDGSNSTSFGTEFGVGDSTYGFALGAYSNSCSGCEAYVRGTMSAIWGSVGMGFGVQDGLYDFGLMLGPNDMHRWGLVVELEDPSGANNNRSSFGLGYSFVLPQFTFSLDIAKQSFQDATLDSQPLMVSSGMAIRVDIFSLSLNYNFYLNDNNRTYGDKVWIGIGTKPFANWQFTFYGEYVDRWTLMASYYF